MSIAPLSPAPAVERTPPTGNAQQVSQLNQLVSKYKGDITRQVSPQVLASLARQIVADERSSGEHVVLPRGPSAAASAKVNVTA